jgi:hypothetical protein
MPIAVLPAYLDAHNKWHAECSPIYGSGDLSMLTSLEGLPRQMCYIDLDDTPQYLPVYEALGAHWVTYSDAYPSTPTQ